MDLHQKYAGSAVLGISAVSLIDESIFLTLFFHPGASRCDLEGEMGWVAELGPHDSRKEGNPIQALCFCGISASANESKLVSPDVEEESC